MKKHSYLIGKPAAYGLLLLSFSALAFTANAGKKENFTLSATDTADINLKAKTTLQTFFDKLNILADPDQGAAIKNGIINQLLDPPNNVFTSRTQHLESDLNPDKTVASEDLKVEVNSYLNDFVNGFKANTSAEFFVTFSIREISAVKFTKSRDQEYLRIAYSENFNGSNSSGKPYPKNYRVAELAISKEGNKWRTLITGMYFEKSYNIASDDASYNVPVTGGRTETVDLADVKSDDYYEYLIRKGDHALAEAKYADAYMAYKESGDGKKTAATSDSKVTFLISSMKNANHMEYQNDLYRGLSAKGADLESKHRYEDARRAYQYAFIFQPTDNTLQDKILALNDKISLAKKLEGLYNLSQFDQAIAEYQTAIAADNANPFLYVGLARCYTRKQNNYYVNRNLDIAKKLDPSNAEVYKAYAEFYEQKSIPDFDKAYTNYSLCVGNIDKDDPTMKDVFCRMTYEKGLKSFDSKQYPEAIDSFTHCIAYQNNFIPAYTHLADIYVKQKKYQEARDIIERALLVAPKSADAHYWKGKVAVSEKSTPEAQEIFINEINTALTYDPNNCGLNYELGNLYITKQDYAKAMEHLTRSIDAKGGQSIAAFWSRGKCNYLSGNFDQAVADMDSFEQKKGVTINSFYIDFGNALCMKAQAARAKTCFLQANYPADPEACLGMAKVAYLENPSDKTKYLDAFKAAFEKNISLDKVNGDPFLVKNLEDDGDYKKLKKKILKY